MCKARDRNHLTLAICDVSEDRQRMIMENAMTLQCTLFENGKDI